MVADIDLSSLMPQLDATASEVVGQQKDALLERKDLAQRTKDFRKLDDADKLTEYKTLLKCKPPDNTSLLHVLTISSISDLH